MPVEENTNESEKIFSENDLDSFQKNKLPVGGQGLYQSGMTKEEFLQNITEKNVSVLSDKLIALCAAGKTNEADNIYPGFSEKYSELIKAGKNPDGLVISQEDYQKIKSDVSSEIADIAQRGDWTHYRSYIDGELPGCADYICRGDIVQAEYYLPGVAEKYGEELKKYTKRAEFAGKEVVTCDMPDKLRKEICDYLSNGYDDWQNFWEGEYRTQDIEDKARREREYQKTIEETEFSAIKDMTNLDGVVLKNIVPFPNKRGMYCLVFDHNNNDKAEIPVMPKTEACKLSLKDYQAIAYKKNIDATERKLTVLVAHGQYEEADKIIPGFSAKYKDQIEYHANQKRTDYSTEVSSTIRKDIVANFSKICPDFIKQTDEQWKSDRQKLNVTESMEISDNQFTILTEGLSPSEETKEVAAANRQTLYENVARLATPERQPENSAKQPENSANKIKSNIELKQQLRNSSKPANAEKNTNTNTDTQTKTQPQEKKVIRKQMKNDEQKAKNVFRILQEKIRNMLTQPNDATAIKKPVIYRKVTRGGR